MDEATLTIYNIYLRMSRHMYFKVKERLARDKPTSVKKVIDAQNTDSLHSLLLCHISPI